MHNFVSYTYGCNLDKQSPMFTLMQRSTSDVKVYALTCIGDIKIKLNSRGFSNACIATLFHVLDIILGFLTSCVLCQQIFFIYTTAHIATSIRNSWCLNCSQDETLQCMLSLYYELGVAMPRLMSCMSICWCYHVNMSDAWLKYNQTNIIYDM